MKKIFVTLVALFATVTLASATDYNWAAGVRGGSAASGVSVKKNMGNSAIEGVASFHYGNSLGITGLYELKSDLGSGFDLYYGAGAHVLVGNVASAGIDGVVGVEYQLPNAPLAFSFDYKPNFDFKAAEFDFADFSFGVRYCW